MSYVSPLPVAAAVLTSLRGQRTNPITGAKNTEHRGVDFGVPTGTPVFAAADGKVATSTQDSAAGNYIIADHAGGRRTAYLHLDTRAVRAGETVKAGQQIARSGNTGNSTGPHLHFEVRQKSPAGGADIRLDPLDFLPYTYRVSSKLQQVLGTDTITGGQVGGTVALLLAAGVGAFLYKRHKRKQKVRA